MSKNLWIAVGGALVGALIVFLYNIGIAPTPPTLASGRCGGNPHCITVSIISVNGKPQIGTVADEKVKANENAVPIFWEIQNLTGNGLSYTFPANGIDFYPATTTKTATPAPAGEFNCTPQSSTRFKCDNRNKNMGSWPYTVTVQGPDPASTPPPLDPFIINN